MDTLLIITLVMSVACFGCLIYLMFRQNKNSNTDIKEQTTQLKNEIEKIQTLVRNDNEHILKSIREGDESLFNYIKDYNAAFNNQILEAFKLQREQLDNIEKRINELLKSNDIKLEKIDATLGENMKRLQESNEKKLEQMRVTVDEKLQSTLEKRLNTSFNLVSERLQEVYKSLGEMKGLAGDVGDLKKVLSNIKTRGTWGEIQLGSLLEQMLSPEQYKEQFTVDKNSSERVDFAIVMPGKDDNQIYLPIDAKYPIEAYQRLVEASENSDIDLIEKSEKEIENAVKLQAKEISKKYIKVPLTTDFAIMYLPIEGLYAEVIRNTELIQLLQRDYRIMVCGPTTLAALLNSLQLGFKTLAIEKRSSEVWSLLALFKNEFGKFCDLLTKTQKKLNEASSTIDDAAKKTRTIERKLKSVDSLAPNDDSSIDNLITFETEED